MCAMTPETAPTDGDTPRAGTSTIAPSTGATPATGVFLRVMGMPCFIHVIRHEGLRGPMERAEGALRAP